jgi:hypothetical protein
MSGRKKHRVIVEVTFDKNVTAKHAVSVVRETMIRGEIEAMCSAHRVKEAERAIQAELRNRERISASRVSSTGES